MIRPNVTLVYDGFTPPNDLRLIIREFFVMRSMPLDAWCDLRTQVCDLVVFDYAMDHDPDIVAVGNWMRNAAWRPPAIHVAPTSIRKRLAAEGLLKSDYFVPRPLDMEELVRLATSLARARVKKTDDDARWIKSLDGVAPSIVEGLAATQAAIDSLFAAVQGGSRLDTEILKNCAEAMVRVAANGELRTWVDGVKRHHDMTYQHCLLVTGIAVGFARFLGMSGGDLDRIATASLMHDVGKAHIPLAILDKPSSLTPGEMDIVRLHPEAGADALEKVESIDARILHAVRHHHEYLDGSGYPGKIGGADIPDLTRFITIADIFSALIEKRAYKPALSGAEAYAILSGMDGKLDMPLVRAFQPFAATL